MRKPILVALVEDQRGTSEGVSSLIGSSPGFQVCGEYKSMEQAIDQILRNPPDVLLIDIALPGPSGIEDVKRLHTLNPALPILMLTALDSSDSVFNAICAGASGYLLKQTPPARLLESIREIHEGGAPMSPEIARKLVSMVQQPAPPKQEQTHLSDRQLELLRSLAEGHSYKACAASMEVGIDTIRSHVRKIYQRLQVHSRSEAVWKALEGGLLQREKP